MLISHTHNYIFIHIYKTAGTSVMDEFLPNSRLLDRLAYEYWASRKIYSGLINLMGWHDDGLKQFTGHHKHAKAYEVEEKLGSNEYQSYYKFSFVRNPFDFMVSIYSYILQAKNHALHSKAICMNFTEFLRLYLSSEPPHQVDFLMSRSREKRLVDYIGRFEHLSEDVSIIKKELGLQVNERLAHKNPSVKRKSKDYRDYYDDDSRRLLLRYYQLDFELLGYSYDGFTESIPLQQNF